MRQTHTAVQSAAFVNAKRINGRGLSGGPSAVSSRHIVLRLSLDGAVKSRGRRGGRPVGRPPGSGGTGIGRVLKALEAAVIAQQREIAKLVRENARWEAVRRLVAG